MKQKFVWNYFQWQIQFKLGSFENNFFCKINVFLQTKLSDSEIDENFTVGIVSQIVFYNHSNDVDNKH